jgi:hypothetical protein
MPLSRSKIVRAVKRGWRGLVSPIREGLRPPDYRVLRKRLARAERNLQTLLQWHYPNVGCDGVDFRKTLARREFTAYSQDGEDGIFLYIFSRIGTTDRRFVEFGVGNPAKCNSANLVKNFGWRGLLIDCERKFVEGARAFHAPTTPGDPEPVTVVESLITVENINELIGSAGLSGEIDLLSVDIDGNDYWVWKAIEVVHPRVVVIEYNASFGSDQNLITCYDPSFVRFEKHVSGFYYGASLTALAALGRAKGYRLIGCDSGGLNAFFVSDDSADGVFDEATPAQAYYADSRRSRKYTLEQQFDAIRHMEFTTDDELA